MVLVMFGSDVFNCYATYHSNGEAEYVHPLLKALKNFSMTEALRYLRIKEIEYAVI